MHGEGEKLSTLIKKQSFNANLTLNESEELQKPSF
jgi:hypothetical protein